MAALGANESHQVELERPRRVEWADEDADWAAICDAEVAADERNNCWDERQFAANKRTFLARSLEFLLFLHDYDPWAIFKQAASNAATCPPPAVAASAVRVEMAPAAESLQDQLKPHSRTLEQLECLRLPASEFDRKRHKWTRYVRFFVAYLLLKTSLISLAQFMLLKYEYLVPRGHKPPLLPRAFLKRVCSFLGNPLNMLKDSSMVVYLGPPGLNVICLVLFPLHYARRPLDMAPLRFAMKPAHELKRVDWSIGQKLASIRSSLEVYKQQRQRLLLHEGRYNCCKAPSVQARPYKQLARAAAHKLLALELAYCAQLSASLDQCERRLYALRPVVFGAKYLETSSALMSRVNAFVNVSYWLGCIVLVLAVALSPYLERCPARRQAFEAAAAAAAAAAAGANETALGEPCALLDIYSPSEMLLLVELPIALLLGYWVATLNMDLFSIVSLSQMRLIKSIKSQLLNCTRLINARRHNQTRLAARSSLRTDESLQGERRSSPPQVAGAADASRLKLDEFLLRTLIKLIVCEAELRDNAYNLAEQMLLPIYYAAGLVLLAILTGPFKIPESDAVRRFTVTVVWFNCNAVAISCAHVFSRVLETERIMWRVLATKAATFQPAQPGSSSSNEAPARLEGQRAPMKTRASNGCELARWVPELRCCSFVDDLWIKFVLASSLNIQRYSPRPFGIKLTYQAIIELNFFIVFVYSLSLGNLK